jgi:hypothetical protein
VPVVGVRFLHRIGLSAQGLVVICRGASCKSASLVLLFAFETVIEVKGELAISTGRTAKLRSKCRALVTHVTSPKLAIFLQSRITHALRRIAPFCTNAGESSGVISENTTLSKMIVSHLHLSHQRHPSSSSISPGKILTRISAAYLID